MYAEVTDDLRKRLLVDRQIMGVAQILGADVELPDVDEELQKFNEWLDSEPQPQGPPEERLVLLRALGLRT